MHSGPCHVHIMSPANVEKSVQLHLHKKVNFPSHPLLFICILKKIKLNWHFFNHFARLIEMQVCLCSQTGVKVRECCVACQADFWKIFSTKSGVMNAGWIGGQTFGSVVHYANRYLCLSH